MHFFLRVRVDADMKLVSGLSGQWDSSICCRASREDSGGRRGSGPGRGTQVGSHSAGGGVREHSPRQAHSNLLPCRREAQAHPAQESVHRDGALSRAERSQPGLSGPRPREAPKVSTACGTGPRDQPITPPHLQTFVHILLFPDGIFMREQERPNKISASDKFTAVLPCEKCA